MFVYNIAKSENLQFGSCHYTKTLFLSWIYRGAGKLKLARVYLGEEGGGKEYRPLDLHNFLDYKVAESNNS